MSVNNDIGSNSLNSVSSSIDSSNSNISAQINSLRQKLQQLNTQKKKAKQAGDSEKAKKLDVRIKQTRLKIQ